MAKRKQTAGERIAVEFAKELIDLFGDDAEWTGLEGWQPDVLATWFGNTTRHIDRAIKAAEKRGYERGRKEAR